MQAKEDIQPDLVITEDSNSGYEFYHKLFGETCCSAEGKSNILSYLQKSRGKEILAIVDGAAFGPEIQRVLSLRKAKNIVLFLLESFEWVILRSGIVKDKEIKNVKMEKFLINGNFSIFYLVFLYFQDLTY